MNDFLMFCVYDHQFVLPLFIFIHGRKHFDRDYQPIWNAGYKGITQLFDFMHVSGFERVHWVLTQSHLLRHGRVKNHDTKRTVPTSMSRSRISCDRLTEWFLWYVTSSLRELNLTTQRKNLPCVSRSTLKCCTSPPHLQLERKIWKNPGKWSKYSKSNGK